VHPPSIPENSDPVDWLRRLYIDEPDNYSARSYDDEQWDVMFFIQGRLEIILFDIRAGLPRRVMRFFVDGDNHRSDNNVGIVIPPGVAHAIRVEGTEDAVMVYVRNSKGALRVKWKLPRFRNRGENSYRCNSGR
jgi:hypothetical protein